MMSQPLLSLCSRAALPLAAALLLNACGGGQDTSPAAAGTGQVPDQTAQAAVTRLAVPITTPADPLLQGLAIPADAASRGMWGAVQTWPMNAIHMALLPDGRVLSYGAPANGDSQDGRTFTLWSPQLGFGANAMATSFEAGRVNSFCGTATVLGDGRLMITGGNSPRNSQFFSGGTPLSTPDTAQLADERWYATMLTLPDGRAVMLGGIDPYTEGMYQNPDQAIAAGQVSMTPEVYTPGTGWRSLTGASSRLAFGPDNLRASYPRAWVAPNGEVFGISADQMWWLDVAGNNGSGALRSAGVFKGAPSNATPRNVGATNSAVMFAPGRILQVGGNGAFNGDGFVASDAATVVDINGGTPVLTETARMSAPRRYPSATVLADGRVLVSGGTRRGNDGGAEAVYAAEIWNPATGTWTVGPNAARIRVYHSTALLLPNGAVLSAGGGTPGPVFNLNAEVYYPPYLFRSQGGSSVLAARPVLTGINALTHAPGGRLVAELRDATTTIGRMVLVKAGTVTHSFNNGQRFIPLNFTQNGDLLQATLPASNNTVPPGAYMLVAIDTAGVPSHAVMVRVTAGAAAAPVALARNTPLLLQSGAVADGVIAVDAANLGILQALGSSPDAATLARSQWLVRDGLADAACVSLELAAQPGRYLRHAGFRLQLAASDGSDLFRNDATFCPEPGISGQGLSLRSKNFPGHLLRARGNELWIDPQAADVPFGNSASFGVRMVQQQPATPLPSFSPLPAAPVQAVAAGTASVTYTPGLDAAGLSFSWSFGDGSASTAFAATSAVTHAFAQPGVYTVTLTARNAAGQTASTSFLQAVHAAPAAGGSARSSSALLHEARTGASSRLWVANPDGNSVGVIDLASNSRVAEVAVGNSPRSLARAGNGQVWVVNRGAATVSVIDPGTLAVVRTIALPAASQPHGLVFSPDGASAYVTLEATGRVLKLDAAGATVASLATGGTPRGLAISADGSRLFVSRFITAPLPGEGTASVTTTGNVGGELWLVNTAAMTAGGTVWLRHSDRADNAIQGAGVPNYLAAPVVSPDGRSAWVPSKQDNVKRGLLRNGLNLDFQNTVRAVSSRIDLSGATPAEQTDRRVDHDNASLASAAAFHPNGAYLFVALETSRQVAVVDAARGLELFRVDTGLAPQALAVSPDGLWLYVQNLMGRSVNLVDLAPLVRNGRIALVQQAALATQGGELLGAAVLQGKRLFYDARDPRLARDSYMSCATCHSDAGHDGRTWDFTGFGEGLRNTPALKGRAALGQGFVHWSANFDEVQDFEGQIRNFAGGTGLMPDAQFNTGTRNTPLGDRKAGLSADLDALAAYLASLNAVDPSPNRQPDGGLSAAALAGKAVFANANCASCHGGAGFTGSGDGGALKNVGTLKPASGQRLGGALAGIDVPTLRDVWATAPYLHDGSAPTLAAAVQAHAGNTVAGTDLANLVAYLQQIGSQEPAPAGPVAPTPGNGTGLRASYFGNPDLAGTAVLTRTELPWFDWGVGAPAPGVAADNFSVRWAGEVQALEGGAYQFRTVSDDGVRVWVNGVQVINNWTVHAPTTDTSGTVVLAAGQRVSIVVEFQEFGGGAVLQLSWLRPGGAWAAVPAAQLYPAAAPANQAPTVSLTAPANNASVAQGSTVNLAASAADADGSIARVEFYDGATLLATDTTAPYAHAWTGAAVGAHTLTARAVDNAGATSTSAAVALTVTAATAEQPPANATACASEGGTCTLPAGATASVWYGAGSSWVVRTGVTGSIACTNAVFGDPLFGIGKACRLLVTTAAPTAGLRGEYFSGTALAGSPLATRFEAVNFDWGMGSPGAPVPADGFSVRWRGVLTLPAGGSWRLRTVSDDGVRLWVNNVQRVNRWNIHSPTTDTTAALSFSAGQRVPIVLEYFENAGGAVMQLQWRRPGSLVYEPVPISALSPQ